MHNLVSSIFVGCPLQVAKRKGEGDGQEVSAISTFWTIATLQVQFPTSLQVWYPGSLLLR